MKSAGFDYLETRNLKQDPLKNTFGVIHLHCGSNNNPTVGLFVVALKTNFINGLAYAGLRNANCGQALETWAQYGGVPQSSRTLRFPCCFRRGRYFLVVLWWMEGGNRTVYGGVQRACSVTLKWRCQLTGDH